LEIYAPTHNERRGRVFSRTPGFTEKVAAQIPGVSKGAFDVAKHFGTVEAMVMAGVEDWEKVKIGVNTKDGKRMNKIGGKRAEELHNIWRRR
jgi:hypothetical protein